MSRSFTKLFSSITESTVWGEPYPTRILWVAMLAMADSKGTVNASVPGLARRAGITLDECETALATFQQPDKYSRTADYEGRRIEPVDGGWRLLNYTKYREMRDEETKRMADAERQRRHRAAMANVADCHGESVTGRDSHTPSQEVAQAEAEAEKEKEQGASPVGNAPPSDNNPIPYQAIVDLYNSTMANLPKVLLVTKARKTAIRRAWTENMARQSVEKFWKPYFEECADDPFYNGIGPYRSGHENWRPDFDFLIRPAVIVKVYERAMQRMEAKP